MFAIESPYVPGGAAGATVIAAVRSAEKAAIARKRTYPLAEAAAAHSDLEARRCTGKSLLLA